MDPLLESPPIRRPHRHLLFSYKSWLQKRTQRHHSNPSRLSAKLPTDLVPGDFNWSRMQVSFHRLAGLIAKHAARGSQRRGVSNRILLGQENMILTYGMLDLVPFGFKCFPTDWLMIPGHICGGSNLRLCDVMVSRGWSLFIGPCGWDQLDTIYTYIIHSLQSLQYLLLHIWKRYIYIKKLRQMGLSFAIRKLLDGLEDNRDEWRVERKHCRS